MDAWVSSGAIRGVFEQEREALEGRGQIEVRSAYPLTPEEEGRIGEAMSKRLGVSVSLSVIVDPDLIGGVVVSRRRPRQSTLPCAGA